MLPKRCSVLSLSGVLHRMQCGLALSTGRTLRSSLRWESALGDCHRCPRLFKMHCLKQAPSPKRVGRGNKKNLVLETVSETRFFLFQKLPFFVSETLCFFHQAQVCTYMYTKLCFSKKFRKPFFPGFRNTFFFTCKHVKDKNLSHVLHVLF